MSRRGMWQPSGQRSTTSTLMPSPGQLDAAAEVKKINNKLRRIAKMESFPLPKFAFSPCVHAAEGCKKRGIYTVPDKDGKWCSNHRDEAMALKRAWDIKHYGN